MRTTESDRPPDRAGAIAFDALVAALLGLAGHKAVDSFKHGWSSARRVADWFIMDFRYMFFVLPICLLMAVVIGLLWGDRRSRICTWIVAAAIAVVASVLFNPFGVLMK
jgi:hypothetical protein